MLISVQVASPRYNIADGSDLREADDSKLATACSHMSQLQPRFSEGSYAAKMVSFLPASLPKVKNLQPSAVNFEADRLTIRNRDFAMMWVATIHPEVWMCVRGLDIQVITYQAIPKKHFRVQKGHFIGQPWSCQFNGRVVTVEIFYEDS